MIGAQETTKKKTQLKRVHWDIFILSNQAVASLTSIFSELESTSVKDFYILRCASLSFEVF